MIKMELKVYDISGKEKGSVKLPEFKSQYRPDLIKRAVLALQALFRQPYGAYPRAGMRQSAELSRKRRDYRGSYGKGISRVPRKIMNRRGSQMMMVGAVAPGTVGGRRAHAPKAEKVWEKKVNVKENRAAILSAISASLNREMVEGRGHQIPNNYPFAVADEFENLQKTKDAVSALNALGFQKEIERASVRKIRAGHGKARGRPYKTKKSLLVVVSKNCKLKDALENVTGVDVARLDELNAQLLAPGTHAGRAVLFTESAVKEWNERKLYI